MVALAHPSARMRAMMAADLPEIGVLESVSYEFPWAPGIFADCLKAGYPCWVLCVGEAIAGYGILSVGAGEAHVLNICVDPARRGQGLGRYLLQRLLNVARWNAAERVFLEVRPSNPVARVLYESVGFQEIGRRPRYYPAREGREEAIVMALDLMPQT
ncbi:MAG: ribosomal protein S18-alanine N-acetyltransferase [Rhodanobacter sp.]